MVPVGPFALFAPLARGAVGEVWRGEHVESGVPVAVKVLSPRFANRLIEEVRVAAALHHPHVIWLYDHGVADAASEQASRGAVRAGAPWMAMDLAEGGTLKERGRRLDWWDLSSWLGALLDALGHAHARGILHRDVKPGNVLFGGARPGPKLSDFGIARVQDDRPDASRGSGTRGYAAPEQIQGRSHDEGPWTDLFAVGVLAWSLAAGTRPWDSTPLGRLPRLVPRFAVPDGFEDWVRSLLVLDPAQRCGHAAEASSGLVALGHPLRRASPPATRARGFEPDWRRAGADTPAPLVGAGLETFGLRVVPLVGRERERDALWDVLRRVAEDGRPRVAIVHGPAGVGRTALAEWLLYGAGERGARALRARWRDGAGPTGLGSLVESAVGRGGAGDREALVARVTAWLRGRGVDDEREALALAELVRPPDREEVAAGLPRVRLEGEDERLALARRLLAVVAGRGPVVVLLEDPERDGLALVRRTLEGDPPTPPVLFLVTARDDRLADAPEVERELAVLRTRHGALDLELDALADDDVSRLLDLALGLAPAVSRRLVERAAGNPAFALELVGDLVSRRALRPSPDGFVVAPGVDPALPPSLAGTWETRVERLLADHPGDRAPLEIAAVLGREVDLGEWAAACARAGFAPPEPLAARLVSARLARLDPEAVGRVSFAHGMLREAVLGTAARAGRLVGHHRTCADVLASTGGANALARRARHLADAGDGAAAIDLWLAVSAARETGGDFAGALDALDRRDALLDQHSAPAADPRRIASAVPRLRLRWRLGIRDGVIEAEEGVLAVGDDAKRAEVLAFRANRLSTEGRLREAVDLAAAAVELAERSGDPSARFHARLEHGRTLVQGGDPDAAIEALEQAIALARDPAEAATAALDQSSVWLVSRRDFARAEQAVDRGVVLAGTVGALYPRARAAYYRGSIAAYRDRLEEADTWYAESEACFRTMGGRVGMASARLACTLVHVRQGRFHEARGAFAELLADPAVLPAQRRWANVGLLACVAADPDAAPWRACFAGLGPEDWVEVGFAQILEIAGDRALGAGYGDRAHQAWGRALGVWRRHDPDRAVELERRLAASAAP